MKSTSILNGVVLGWFFALWLGARLIDVNVPIISIPSDRLRESIDSAGLYCPYSLTVEQYWRKGLREDITIEGGKGTIFLFREKIASVLRNSSLLLRMISGLRVLQVGLLGNEIHGVPSKAEWRQTVHNCALPQSQDFLCFMDFAMQMVIVKFVFIVNGCWRQLPSIICVFHLCCDTAEFSIDAQSDCRDGANVVQWFLQQIRVDQLLMEVFLSEYIWITVLGAAIACAMSRMLVFDPFIVIRNAPMQYIEEMKMNENAYITNLMRQFVLEKVLVLAYVIVRNPEKEQFFSARVPTASTFELTHRVTDATVFAIWFILVWSVTSVTVAANQRFETIVGFLKTREKPDTADDDVKANAANDDIDIAKSPSSKDGSTAKESSSSNEVNSRKASSSLEDVKSSSSEHVAEKTTQEGGSVDPNYPETILIRRLLVVLMACFFTATAMTSFGFTSFKVIHSFYALVITVEGLNLLVRSLYVTYRIAWWQASRSSPLGNSETFQARLCRAKRLTDVLYHSFSCVQYALYLVIGTIINGKLIPLVFVARLTHHILQMAGNVYDHFTGRETSRFID